MADNFTTNAGAGGDTFAADEIATIKHQRVKVQFGEDGSATDASATNPLPVTSASLPLPSGAATAANQTTEITSLELIDDIVHAINGALNKAVAVAGQLDDTATTAATEDNVAPVRITAQRGAHVNLRSNSGTEIATSGNPLRVDPTGTTTQPVSLASSPLPTGAATEVTLASVLTSVQLIDDAVATDGAAVPTKGIMIAGNDGTNAQTIAVDTLGRLQIEVLEVIPLTGGANLGKGEDSSHTSGDTGVAVWAVRRDAPAVGSGTDGDYSTINVDDLGRLYQTGANRTASGALGAADAAVTVKAEAAGTIHWEIDTGTLVGTVVFEATLDDTNWFAVNAVRINGTIIASTASFADRGALDCGGYSQVRLRVSVYTSGTSNARLEASPAANVVRLGQALPAGANAIGKLAANDGVDIGDVTVNNAAGASAVNIQDGGNSITVDGTVTLGAGSANVGDVDVLTVPAPLSTTGGGTEATALRVTVASDSTGVLSVDDNGSSLTVDNGGTFAVQATVAASATNIAKAEDAASADLDVGVPAMAVRKATPANTSGTDGDYEMLQMSAGRLWTSATIDAAIPAGTNNIGDVDIISLPNEGQQTMANSISVAVASDQSTIPTGGNIAHDGVDSGNPVKLGMRALAHGTNPTAVAAADRTDWLANRAGIPWVIGGHPNVKTTEWMATDAQTNDPIVTVATGLKIVVTKCSAMVDNATTVDVGVRIGFGTASVPTEPTTGNTVDGVILSHPGIAPGSGVIEGSGAGIIGIGADDEDVRITSEVPTSGKLRVIVTYYTIES